ncbi:hypothetical protein I3842_01G004200 [Carya illinoinensis]|uniref:Uncharacterized protein n=1 Tax=Carya illinoinensis TaxID=32201 RepID=A0A922K218_CARIL|nr:hypothetical protein I3842_01G004200 [Carya illinoinensis]
MASPLPNIFLFVFYYLPCHFPRFFVSDISPFLLLSFLLYFLSLPKPGSSSTCRRPSTSNLPTFKPQSRMPISEAWVFFNLSPSFNQQPPDFQASKLTANFRSLGLLQPVVVLQPGTSRLSSLKADCDDFFFGFVSALIDCCRRFFFPHLSRIVMILVVLGLYRL